MRKFLRCLSRRKLGQRDVVDIPILSVEGVSHSNFPRIESHTGLDYMNKVYTDKADNYRSLEILLALKRKVSASGYL